MYKNVCSVKFDLINFSSAIVRLLFKMGRVTPPLPIFPPNCHPFGLKLLSICMLHLNAFWVKCDLFHFTSIVVELLFKWSIIPPSYPSRCVFSPQLQNLYIQDTPNYWVICCIPMNIDKGAISSYSSTFSEIIVKNGLLDPFLTP